MKGYDTVFRLEDFVNLAKAEGGVLRDTRICIRHDGLGEFLVRATVLLTIKLPDRILRCEVARRDFNRLFAFNKDTEESKQYREWVEKAYAEAEKALGFKPVEGYWE